MQSFPHHSMFRKITSSNWHIDTNKTNTWWRLESGPALVNRISVSRKWILCSVFGTFLRCVLPDWCWRCWGNFMVLVWGVGGHAVVFTCGVRGEILFFCRPQVWCLICSLSWGRQPMNTSKIFFENYTNERLSYLIEIDLENNTRRSFLTLLKSEQVYWLWAVRKMYVHYVTLLQGRKARKLAPEPACHAWIGRSHRKSKDRSSKI